MLLKVLLPLFCFSSFAFATTTLISPAPAGSAQLQFLSSFLPTAHNAYSRTATFSFVGVNGDLAFVRNTDPLNYIDIDLNLNGSYYLIPTAWASADNYFQLMVEPMDTPGLKAGLYIFQSGFQWSSVLDGLARVDAIIRITGADGKILPQLEYQQTSNSAHTPTLGQFFPRNVSDPVAGFLGRRPAAHVNEQSVSELQPGSFAYADAQVSLNRAARPEIEAYYETYAFQNLNGEATFVGATNDDFLLSINSHIFELPNHFDHDDNVTSFQITDSLYYLVQSGFRKNSVSGQMERVVSTSQIADESGAILPAMQYSETVTPLSTPLSQYVLDDAGQATPTLIIADPHE